MSDHDEEHMLRTQVPPGWHGPDEALPDDPDAWIEVARWINQPRPGACDVTRRQFVGPIFRGWVWRRLVPEGSEAAAERARIVAVLRDESTYYQAEAGLAARAGDAKTESVSRDVYNALRAAVDEIEAGP